MEHGYLDTIRNIGIISHIDAGKTTVGGGAAEQGDSAAAGRGRVERFGLA